MASRWFIINEWLLNDLLGHNGPDELRRSDRFLRKLVRGPDGVIVLWKSAWMDKAWELMEKEDEERRQRSILFQTELVRNRNRFRWLMDHEVRELPDNLQSVLDEGKIDRDDEYLLQTWFSCPEDINVDYIVTSDSKLIRDLKEHWPEVRTRHRDDFLADYLGRTSAR